MTTAVGPGQPATSPPTLQRSAGAEVFNRCLTCDRSFPGNEELEHFPVGRRVAYDPSRGRLWAICKGCSRWTLAPIEERWEALEELEKLVTDRARLLARTDNVSLFRAASIEVVRVGSVELREEWWWRYGSEFARRRKRHRRVAAVGTAAGVGVGVGSLATGAGSLFVAWLLADHLPDTLQRWTRWLRFGSVAWRGRNAVCLRCSRPPPPLRFDDRGSLLLTSGAENESIALELPCPACRRRFGSGAAGLRPRPAGPRSHIVRIEGAEAEALLRRVLAYHHFAGASKRRVASATRLVEEAGSPGRLAEIVSRNGRGLSTLGRTGSIALEIAANQSTEQRLLEMEVSELEAQWRREEELAGIVDGELTPFPGLSEFLEGLRRRGNDPPAHGS